MNQMTHKFIRKSGDYTLLLLHGTGGDENDLLPLAPHLDHTANVLSVKGNVLENGMPRFFERYEDGTFNLESLENESHKLYNFIQWAVKEYGLDESKIVAVGYSNGANMAVNLMQKFGKVFNKAILFHSMLVHEHKNSQKLNNIEVFLVAGLNDPLIPYKKSEYLKSYLEQLGANVEFVTYFNGHRLTAQEINDAGVWLKRKIKN